MQMPTCTSAILLLHLCARAVEDFLQALEALCESHEDELGYVEMIGGLTFMAQALGNSMFSAAEEQEDEEEGEE